MYRLRPHWIGSVALAGTIALGARLASSVPVTRHATPAAELRVGVEAGVVRITGVEWSLLDAAEELAPGAWQEALGLHVTAAPSTPAVAGSYRVDGGSVVFTPAFPLVAGVPYDLEIDLNRLRAPLRLPITSADDRRTHRILIPATPLTRQAVISSVRPSSSELPANLLRLYLHFSRPMRDGDAVNRLRLLDDSGRVVPGAFLDPAVEMWDASHRRLTVLFDPGRIKRGLRPNRELGPPLVEGRRYTLRVDPGWRDAEGAPLASGFSQQFVVGPAERRALDPAAWRVTKPAAGTSDPLLLYAPVALDHALVPRHIGVHDSTGARVSVRARLDEDERTVRLVPAAAWLPGAYRLVVSAEMEDVAGNTVTAPFDLDLADPKARRSASEFSRSMRLLPQPANLRAR